MTADITPLFPIAGQADDTVRRTIKGLMKGRDIAVEDIAPDLGMSPSSLYRKLAGKGDRDAFKAGEVATIALILGVSVAQLYDGLGGTFVPPTGGPGGGIGADDETRTRNILLGMQTDNVVELRPAASTPAREIAA